MVLRSKKFLQLGKFEGEPVKVSELSAEELEYLEICLVNSEHSDHPDAKHGAHPDVHHYYQDLIARRPEKAIELLITTNRASTQMAQELARVQALSARDWYESQSPEIQERVNARLSPDLPPSLALHAAVSTVKEEMKAALKLKPPPPGMSAMN